MERRLVHQADHRRDRSRLSRASAGVAGRAGYAPRQPGRATDDDIGREDKFPVDRHTEQDSSRVLRAGYLCGKKDVRIPVLEITQIDEDRVYLTLNKEELADLSTIPVRRWHEDVRGE